LPPKLKRSSERFMGYVLSGHRVYVNHYNRA
jgi:hypothetical protein